MFCEITLTKFDGTRLKKYWVTAENVYEQNKIVAGLISDFHRVFEELPLVDVYDIQTAVDDHADYLLPKY